MIVVDASVTVSVLHPPDVNYHVSHAWLRQYLRTGGELVAPILLLSEVVGAITRRTGNPALGRQAARRLWQLPELHRVLIDELLGVRTTEMAADLGLRGADAVYVALAAQLQIPLVTWNRQQHERGGQRVDARTPDHS
jgi:predicted nucleic acid-binding protein